MRSMMRYGVLVGLCLWLGLVSSGFAQESEASTVARAPFLMNVRSGPNIFYHFVNTLQADAMVNIIGRNKAGTWLHIQQLWPDGTIATDGWVLTGFLSVDPLLDIGEIPVDESMPDGDSAFTYNALEGRLYDLPLIPIIHESMFEVYAAGQEAWNLPNKVSKDGDSLITNELFLESMASPFADVGNYKFLQADLDWFGPQMTASIAAKKGLTSALTFDPFWADAQACEANEGALACEFRLHQPSVAIISFGMNDVKVTDTDYFKAFMQKNIEATLEAGVIPVLMTFSCHPDSDNYVDALAFNVVLIELAEMYQIPIINLWLATRALPDYGLEADLIHLKNSGFAELSFRQGEETFSGVAMQNLLVLRMLHELRLTLGMDEGEAGA
ncbi:hypothetical protein MASR2M15_07910 [Anaerolineales bacterium]